MLQSNSLYPYHIQRLEESLEKGLPTSANLGALHAFLTDLQPKIMQIEHAQHRTFLLDRLFYLFSLIDYMRGLDDLRSMGSDPLGRVYISAFRWEIQELNETLPDDLKIL